MAEDLVDRVIDFEGWEKRECRTRDLRIETSGSRTVSDFAGNEMARSVEDVLARRTRGLVEDARGAAGRAEEVARELAVELERDESWAGKQVEDFRRLATDWTY